MIVTVKCRNIMTYKTTNWILFSGAVPFSYIPASALLRLNFNYNRTCCVPVKSYDKFIKGKTFQSKTFFQSCLRSCVKFSMIKFFLVRILHMGRNLINPAVRNLENSEANFLTLFLHQRKHVAQKFGNGFIRIIFNVARHLE